MKPAATSKIFSSVMIGIFALIVTLIWNELLKSAQLHVYAEWSGALLFSLVIGFLVFFSQLMRLRQKEVEEANRKLAGEVTERKRLTEILEATPDFIATANMKGEVLYYNKGARKILGIREDEDISNVHIPDTHPEWAGKKVLNEAIPAAIRDGVWYGETAFLGRDGKEIPALQLIMAHKMPDGTVEYLSTIARDITELKQVERELRESEARLTDAQRIARIGSWERDIATGEIKFSAEIFRILGLTLKESHISFQTFLNAIHPDDVEFVKKSINEALNDKKPYDIEYRLILPDGSIKTVHAQGEVDFDNSGSPIKIRGTAQDITEIKKMEEVLKESENRYRMLVETMNEGLGMQDENGIATYFNDSFCKMTGYSIDELIGRPNVELFDDANRQIMMDQMAKRKEGEARRYEIAFTKKDGSKLHAIIAPRPIYDVNGKFKGSFAVITDITERKKIEEQLLQSQKMEAVGQLTGGIAHEFNNILAAINGYAEFTLMKMKDDDQFRRNVEEIAAAGEKAAKLVRSIMTFSRKNEFSPTPKDLNWIIVTLKNTLLRLIGEDVALNISIANKDLIILADSSQIEQVLINLALNARDAMPGGGVLSISTEFVPSPQSPPAWGGEANKLSGAHALITVTDTGAGMDEKTRKRVFEPFFTTKDVGEGTGLGLSVVYGIIKQHNGWIDLYSEPGGGTMFKIYLPLTDRKAEAEKQREIIPHGRGIETVLVAEDEAAVRQFTSILLKEFGYDVIEAVDGNDAVNKFVENKDRIDLVLLDVIMPYRNGKEVYEEIKRVRADMKIVFMSGYPANIVNKKGTVEEGFSFIPKPVSPDELLKRVREALDNDETQDTYSRG